MISLDLVSIVFVNGIRPTEKEGRLNVSFRRPEGQPLWTPPHRRSADYLPSFLGILKLIPDEARDFGVPWAMAQRDFALPDEVLTLMVREGLARTEPEASLFDHFDLLNIAFELQAASPRVFGPTAWAKILRSAATKAVSGSAVVSAEVEYIPECGHDAADGSPCRFVVLLPSGWSRCHDESQVDGDGTSAVVHFDLPTVWPPYDPGTIELIEEFRSFRFVRLPPSLSADVGFIRGTRIADCYGFAALMVEEGRRRGLPIRMSQGLILSPPFSVIHYWAEIKVEDIWVPNDPLITGAMLRWGLLDPQEWDHCRSIGAILARISGRHGPLALDHGQATGVSFATKISTTRPLGGS